MVGPLTMCGCDGVVSSVSRRRRLAKHRHEELGDAACGAELNHDRLYAMAVDASISAGVVDTVDGRVSGVVPSPSWLLDLFTPSVQADRAAALRAGGDDGLAAGRTTAPAASMSAQGTLMKLHYLALYVCVWPCVYPRWLCTTTHSACDPPHACVVVQPTGTWCVRLLTTRHAVLAATVPASTTTAAR